MSFKGLLIILLLGILVSLFAGLYFLVHDEGQSTRMVKALTLRIVLSILLFIVLAWGFYHGLIVPHELFSNISR